MRTRLAGGVALAAAIGVWAVATDQGELTARRLVITVVPTTLEMEMIPSRVRVDRAARNAATPC